jgi:hypothetical protein
LGAHGASAAASHVCSMTERREPRGYRDFAVPSLIRIPRVTEGRSSRTYQHALQMLVSIDGVVISAGDGPPVLSNPIPRSPAVQSRREMLPFATSGALGGGAPAEEPKARDFTLGLRAEPQPKHVVRFSSRVSFRVARQFQPRALTHPGGAERVAGAHDSTTRPPSAASRSWPSARAIGPARSARCSMTTRTLGASSTSPTTPRTEETTFQRTDRRELLTTFSPRGGV